MVTYYRMLAQSVVESILSRTGTKYSQGLLSETRKCRLGGSDLRAVTVRVLSAQ